MKKFLIKSFLMSLLILFISILPVIYMLDLSAYSQKFLFRGVKKPSDKIVILAIDNESIDWMSKWPWPRSYQAKIVDTLKNAGAKLIVFDVFFDSPTQFNEQDDIAFADSVKAAGNVVFAASYQNLIANNNFKVKKLPFKKPIKILEDVALDIGVVHPEADIDNQVRRFQILFKSGDSMYYSLALQVVNYLQSKRNIQILNNNLVNIGDKHIHLRKGKLLINYYGPAQTFTTIPFVRVFDGSYLKDAPGFFKDKIVLIGASAIDLHDVFPTPFDKLTPGVEIHANVIQTILDDNYISNISYFIFLLIVVLMVLINLYFSINLKIKKYFILTIIESIIIYITTYIMFIFFKLEIPTYSLLVGLLTIFIVQTIIKYMNEEKERKKVREVFSQYVAPTVVNELLAHPEMVELGGVLKEVTIFFSDIRSFTTFSENHTPKQVVELLNEYLDAMTQVIFEYGGTLDKYVGDEIMAIFGAPLPMKDHARIAVECCIAQLRKLRILQDKWRSEGKAVLDMGMGLNTGEVVIGNIGSAMHKDYTVIGDAVNLAARLEALTRNYSTPERTCYLLISEFTYNLVKDFCNCKLIDEIAVKGKHKKTKIYEVQID